MTRSCRIETFLAAAGWAESERRPLAGDASARRYVRLARGAARAVLMDASPAACLSVEPFLAVTGWLRGLGLSAPEIYDADPAAGLVLLEDLGDALYLRAAADPAREHEIYAAAIDLLAGLPAAPPAPTPGWTPAAYDRAVLLREVRLAPEWYLPAAAGDLPEGVAAEFDEAIEPVVSIALDTTPTPALRDYHAENLIWLPERPGSARVGLLDYQDLLIGHPAYDVISLLEDARRDISPDLRAAMIDRYLARTGLERDGFLRGAAALAAQRNLKILGLFVRLARRDGKPSYLRHLPRVWNNLMRDLDHPDLGALRAWTARHLPAPDAIRVAGR